MTATFNASHHPADAHPEGGDAADVTARLPSWDWTNSLDFALGLLAIGAVPLNTLQQAAAEQRRQRCPLGKLLVEHRLLTVRQVFEVLDDQGESQEPFSQIVVRKGFATWDQVDALRQLQARRTPSLGEILVRMGALSEEELREHQVMFRFQLAIQAQ